MADGRVLTSGWYAAMIGSPCVSVDEESGSGWFEWLSQRSAVLRGLAIFRAGRSCERLALVHGEPGSGTAMFLEAWLSRRAPRVIVLELIGRRSDSRGLRKLFDELRFRIFARPAVRRCLLVGQALTRPERGRLALEYGIEPDKVRFIPWAWCRQGGELPGFDPAANGVMVSGREQCDWEMTFAAAQGRDWPLTVVCSARDLPRVEALNTAGRATVLHEVSQEQHNELLRATAIYLLPLLDDGRSAGQVRLSSAVEDGAPVVATAVPALDGYVDPGRTAVLIEPGNAEALRNAVDDLLGDPQRRCQLREAAIERGRERTLSDYFADLRALIEEGLE